MKVLLKAISILFIAGVAGATVIHVPADQPNIQTGIDAAVNGDTVLVADGTYCGSGNYNISFQGKAITVKSENGASACVIDCQNNGRGFSFTNSETENSVLSGFTITRGYEYHGGGIYLNSGSPTIKNCSITQNTVSGGGPVSPSGAGLYCGGSSAPLIYNCVILQNDAIDGGGGGITITNAAGPTIDQCTIKENTAGRAGAMNCFSSNPDVTISNCIIAGNEGLNNGTGGIHFCQIGGVLRDCLITGNIGYFGVAGAIHCDWGTDVLISHCVITNNLTPWSSWGGAGIYCEKAEPTIEYCVISGNEAYDGAGILSFWSNPVLEHCTIVENTARNKGGGIRVDGWITIRHCTISRNSAVSGGGGIYYQDPLVDPHLTMENSIIEGNSGFGGIYFETAEGVEIEHSDFWNNEGADLAGYVPDQLGVMNSLNFNSDPCDVFCNIFTDPLFEDPQNGDFELTWANYPDPDSTRSPCIDAGHPEAARDPDRTVADLGACPYEQGPHIVSLIPHSFPISIGAAGGAFDYDLEGINLSSSSIMLDLWCAVTLPDGQIFGPLWGPFSATIPGDSVLSRSRTQTVPAHAAAGPYVYHVYIGTYPDEVIGQDSFPFSKEGMIEGVRSAGWSSSGEDFNGVVDNRPSGLELLEVVPNPFNPSTVIRYQLPINSLVNLAVHDIAGRQVAQLVDGWQDAGTHEVTFDGSGLASGMYFYRLSLSGSGTTPTTKTGKMVLIK